MTGTLLTADFYNRAVVDVAIDLLGHLLVRRHRQGITAGRIVETEAYLAVGDSAAHSCAGRNRRNASMFGPAGRAYVYTIHARQCFNVVTLPRSAVLIRAVEPVRGLALMKQRRATDKLRDLCRGPARLTEAFAISRPFDGWNLETGRRLWIEQPDVAVSDQPVLVSSRIGVTSAAEHRLRFHLSGSEFVSGTKRLNTAESTPLQHLRRSKKGDLA